MIKYYYEIRLCTKTLHGWKNQTTVTNVFPNENKVIPDHKQPWKKKKLESTE